MDPHPLAADPYPRVAEVDLHLMTRRCLEAHRRSLLRLQFPTPMLHPAFYRPQAYNDPMFTRQFLANDVRVALMPEEAFPQPVIEPVERRHARPASIRNDTTLAKVATYRIARAAEFLGDPLRAPATLMQAHHRHHFLRLQHRLSLHRSRQCRCHRNLDRHLWVLSKERGQFFVR